MTAPEAEALVATAARQALGREPTEAEVTRTLAVWLAELDDAVSAGYLSRPPGAAVRPAEGAAADDRWGYAMGGARLDENDLT